MSKFNNPKVKHLLSGGAGENTLQVNGHLHSPYSFCSFDSIEQMFKMAAEENISVLGINDFFSLDGYPEFSRHSKLYKIYPQYNVEFIGLLTNLQEKGIKINDPNNPGRIYFSGKGLNPEKEMTPEDKIFMEELVEESQRQIKEMVIKTTMLTQAIDSDISFTYDSIKKQFAKELVRERHIAQAVRVSVFRKYSKDSQRIAFFTKLYEGKTPSADFSSIEEIENEIRSKLLKSGGKAFVEEDPKAFPPLERIIRFILNMGGIPCYPVLLDDKKGNILTGFESDWDEMDAILKKLGVYTVELIPSRNSVAKLTEFVEYFRNKGYVVFLGSEHNTPGIFPVEVKIEGKNSLSDFLKVISYEGACVIAAHQFLNSIGEVGYIKPSGEADIKNMKLYIELGNAVIKSFTEN